VLAVASEKRLIEFNEEASAVTSADDVWKIEEKIPSPPFRGRGLG
jgi:hypothetical protein